MAKEKDISQEAINYIRKHKQNITKDLLLDYT